MDPNSVELKRNSLKLNLSVDFTILLKLSVFLSLVVVKAFCILIYPFCILVHTKSSCHSFFLLKSYLSYNKSYSIS